ARGERARSDVARGPLRRGLVLRERSHPASLRRQDEHLPPRAVPRLAAVPARSGRPLDRRGPRRVLLARAPPSRRTALGPELRARRRPLRPLWPVGDRPL